MKLLPVTGTGRWSVGLSAIFLILTGMRLGDLFVPVPSMILAAGRFTCPDGVADSFYDYGRIHLPPLIVRMNPLDFA